ncbi:MAG: response regulator [Planctomycetota bacterium]|nr:MAG: response regulator [Planctomycetota bacterium]
MLTARDCTLLIVEDDPFDVKLIQRAMSKARIANPCRILSDGEQAIHYLAGHPPYSDRNSNPIPILMLLDLKLPRKSGFDVIEWVRAQPVLRRLPIIVLTSSAESPDISRAYDLGANSYLVKPVGNDALVDMLQNLELFWLCTNTFPDIA